MPIEGGIRGAQGAGNGQVLRPDSALPGATGQPFSGAPSPMPPAPPGPDIPLLLPQDAPPPMPPTFQHLDVGSQAHGSSGAGGPGHHAPPASNMYPPLPYLGARSALDVPQQSMADAYVNGDGWASAPPPPGRGDLTGYRREGPPRGGAPPPPRAGPGLDRRPARHRPGSPSATAAQARRGQMPIPAWKKAQQEQQNG
jgi:hypothetical protein